MRSLFPIFRTLPSSTVDTFSLRPMSRMSSLLPLNAKDDVREATRSDWILVSALMISSAMPSVKYSLFDSALMSANGSTATDFAADTVCCGIAITSDGDESSACAKSAEVSNRSDGSVAIALLSARSTLSGMLLFTERIGVTDSVNRFARIACAVGPVNGRCPDNISYTTHARLY